MVVAGVAIGPLLSVALTRLVSMFLFGVTPTDPATMGLSAVTLMAAGLGAAMRPARRAARMDPVAALRAE